MWFLIDNSAPFTDYRRSVAANGNFGGAIVTGVHAFAKLKKSTARTWP